jgi:hypothetical protein
MTEYISVAAFIISIGTGIYSWWKGRAAERKAKTTNVMDTSVQALKMLSDVTHEHSRQFILFEEAKLRFHRRTWELQDEAGALGADDICNDIKQNREAILKESKKQSDRDNEIHSALLNNTQTFVLFYKDAKSDEINIRHALLGLHQVMVGTSQVGWGQCLQMSGFEDLLFSWELAISARRALQAAERKGDAADQMVGGADHVGASAGPASSSAAPASGG